MSLNQQRFINAIAEIKANNQDHTLAELIAKVWKDKVVEVYIGDSYEDIKYEDSTTRTAAVLIGKIVAAYAECIVMNCAYIDQVAKKLKYGSIVCLNERAIRTITEVDGTGLLKDTFLSSRDAKLVKELMENEE